MPRLWVLESSRCISVLMLIFHILISRLYWYPCFSREREFKQCGAFVAAGSFDVSTEQSSKQQFCQVLISTPPESESYERTLGLLPIIQVRVPPSLGL